jgi:quinolinate synthase
VISYVNCSAAVKALSDVICTSGNAERIVARVPPDRPILFAPDEHLGRFLVKKTGRPMVLWPGACSVHVSFSERMLIRLKAEHPEAVVLAHPECTEAILAHAHHVGSTKSLLDFATTSAASAFIVVTEPGIIHQMEKACPGKTFIAAPQEGGCACNECPHMRLNTLEKVYACMRDRSPEIIVPDDLRIRAARPLERMLAMSVP